MQCHRLTHQIGPQMLCSIPLLVQRLMLQFVVFALYPAVDALSQWKKNSFSPLYRKSSSNTFLQPFQNGSSLSVDLKWALHVAPKAAEEQTSMFFHDYWASLYTRMV